MLDPSFLPSPSYLDKENKEIARLLKPADGITGGVVLFHDTHPTTRDVLARVIDAYQALGYHFQTMEDYSRWRWGEGVFDTLAEAIPH